VSTMGRSFWILDDISPLHQFAEFKNKGQAFLFEPENTIRYRYRDTNKDDVPYYPEAGVILDYYLPNTPDEPVMLEVLDADNRLIRSYSSTDSALVNSQVTNMATGFTTKLGREQLETGQGMHRFRWDMRHAGPWDESENQAYQGGPMVAPGAYQVRLTVEGQQLSERFEVLPDPRLEQNMAKALEAQEKLALDVIKLEGNAKRAVASIEQEIEALEAKIKAGKQVSKSKKKLATLQQSYDELITAEGTYMKPQLVAQIRYLRYMLLSADQQPGQDAYQRYETLKNQWETLQDKLSSVGNLDLSMDDD